MNKFFIHYKAVFQAKTKTLSGYEVFVTHREDDDRTKGMECLGFEDRGDEYDRLRCMFRQRHAFTREDAEFITQHPLDVIRHIRKEVIPKLKNPDWEKDIGNWNLNLRGERV